MAEPAARRAYSTTKDRILTGEFAAGALLSEVEVAHELRVSRTPVHEAFLRLESEHLLQLIPRRGAVVVAVPASEAVDVLDLRLALESAAVRRLADPGRDLTALLTELEELAARQDGHAAARDVAAFAELDAAFHRAVVTASGNQLADHFYGTLADRQRRMTIGSVGGRPERLPTLVAEHRDLAARIAARDVRGFTAALEAHLSATHSAFHPGFGPAR